MNDTENEVQNEKDAGTDEVAKDTQLNEEEGDGMAHVRDFVDSCDDDELECLNNYLSRKDRRDKKKNSRKRKDREYDLAKIEESVDAEEEYEK